MGRMPDGMVNSRKENKIMLEKVKEIVAESLNVEESKKKNMIWNFL